MVIQLRPYAFQVSFHLKNYLRARVLISLLVRSGNIPEVPEVCPFSASSLCQCRRPKLDEEYLSFGARIAQCKCGRPD